MARSAGSRGTAGPTIGRAWFTIVGREVGVESVGTSILAAIAILELETHSLLAFNANLRALITGEVGSALKFTRWVAF